jgi:hypothetical protein
MLQYQISTKAQHCLFTMTIFANIFVYVYFLTAGTQCTGIDFAVRFDSGEIGIL